MSASDIHLIWFGDKSPPIATDAVRHWEKMGNGRKVILHTDASLLLEKWQDAYGKHGTNPLIQSDLLRWSLLLERGGWYFDCDVRSRKTIDEIEQECSVGEQCFITTINGNLITPPCDIIYCPVNWPGRQFVNDYVLAQEKHGQVHLFTFGSILLTDIHRENPEWIASGDKRYYSMYASSKDRVFVRGVQSGVDFPFDTGAFVAQVPQKTQTGQLGRYSRAVRRWIKAGRPVRSDEEVARIHREYCNSSPPCEHYNPKKQQCGVCGCNVRADGEDLLSKVTGALFGKVSQALCNKIKMATEGCPKGEWKQEEKPRDTTFVYPYLAIQAQGNELLYSVRSVEKFYQGNADIWIVGDRPAWWLRDDRFVDAPRVTGGARIDRANKLQVIVNTPGIPEEFVWMQDDVYFVKPLGYDFLSTRWTRGRPMTAARLKKWTPGKGFAKQKKKTWQVLLANGKSLEDYAAHTPQVYRKANLATLFDKYDLLHKQYVDDLLYYNEFPDSAQPPVRIGGLMYRTQKKPSREVMQALMRNAKMHNHTNGAYNGESGHYLKDAFREQCNWEKDMDKVRATIVPINNGHPKIAVCCPTYGRPDIISTLVGCFARQDYPADRCEMVILDDGDQLVPGTYHFQGKEVRVYSQAERFPTLGEKRNAVRKLVSEDVEAITQWDDDDVFLPWALEAMADRLRCEGIALGSWMYSQRGNGSIILERKVSHTMCAFRLDTFDALGGYPPGNCGEDTTFLSWCIGKHGKGHFPKSQNTIDDYHPYMLMRREFPDTYHANEFRGAEKYGQASKRPGTCVTVGNAPLPSDIQEWYQSLNAVGKKGGGTVKITEGASSRIALIAPALGIAANRIDLFRKQAVAAGIREENVFVDSHRLYGTLNLARVRNRLLRAAIGRDYDIIVQADIDCIFTNETVVAAASAIAGGADLVNVLPRYAKSSNGVDIALAYADAEKRFDAADGGFNVMSPQGWRRTGGFDERYYGYGYEDLAFREQITRLNLDVVRIKDTPLLHMEHEKYSPHKTAERLRNKRFFENTGKPDQPDYLCRAAFRHDFFVLFVTSACTRNCKHCAQQHLRQKFPGYNMSMDEYRDIIGALGGGSFRRDPILHISGGEPALWPCLDAAVDLATRNGIQVFLTTAEPDRIPIDTLNKTTKLFVSMYSTSKVDLDLDKLHTKVRVVDGTKFFPLPQASCEGTWGGKCLCFHPSICNGWVFRCSTGQNVGLQKGIELEDMRGFAEPFGNYFWESAERKYDIGEYCTMCVSNALVREKVGLVQNIS